jgi:Arc/MetJ-type ribon-helix-helix transcriptional regulator
MKIQPRGAVISTNIILSERASAIVQARIDSGEYADANAVVEAALENSEFDAWMVGEVLPTLELNRADPSRSIAIEDTFTYLRGEIRNATKATAA